MKWHALLSFIFFGIRQFHSKEPRGAENFFSNYLKEGFENFFFEKFFIVVRIQSSRDERKM